MKLSTCATAILAALHLSSTLLAQTAARSVSNAPGNTVDANRVTAHVKVLSADDFEGRTPGTSGEKKTVDYLKLALRVRTC